MILTYYWPPSGGSGVQRWMYFAKHLKALGWEPIVITVDEKKAAYPIQDHSLVDQTRNIRVIKTATREPLKWYSRLLSGSATVAIPQGEVNTNSLLGKCAAYIRGNFFIPDARKGWMSFAVKAAKQLLEKETIDHLITTGPPHSTHLIGLELIKHFQLNWWADFRDPWTGVFYNQQMYQTERSKAKDKALEKAVLEAASGILTTLDGELKQSFKTIVPQQKVVAVANGFDHELMESITVQPPKDIFHIVYTGLLTHQQSYSTIIKALQAIEGVNTIRFSIAGNIPQAIKDEIRSALPHIEVVDHGYLSHHAAVCLMKSAHLLLNFIFEGAENQMISGKLLEYIATGIPILSLGNPNTYAGNFLSQGTASKMLNRNQLDEIISFIRDCLRNKGKTKNEFPKLEQWTRKALTHRLIEEVLENV